MTHEIGNNVLAENILTYIEGTPYEGGFELNLVSEIDIGGKVPSFVKSKISKRLA